VSGGYLLGVLRALARCLLRCLEELGHVKGQVRTGQVRTSKLR